MLAPPNACRVDNHAAGKRPLPRRREEAVDVSLLDAIPLAIELALDRAPVTGAVRKFRDEINAGVPLIEAVFLRPVRKGHHTAELGLLRRSVLQPYFDQTLEIRAFLPL